MCVKKKGDTSYPKKILGKKETISGDYHPIVTNRNSDAWGILTVLAGRGLV